MNLYVAFEIRSHGEEDRRAPTSMTQIANVFACRSLRESVFSLGFFSNRLIFAGIAVELLLQLFIVYHPLGNRIFSTAPLPFSVWTLFVPFALALFFAEEMRKFSLRKLRPL